MIKSALIDEVMNYETTEDLDIYLKNKGYERRDGNGFFEYGIPNQPAELRVTEDNDGFIVDMKALKNSREVIKSSTNWKIDRLIKEMYDLHYITEEDMNNALRKQYTDKDINKLERYYTDYKNPGTDWNVIRDIIKDTVNIIKSSVDGYVYSDSLNKMVPKRFKYKNKEYIWYDPDCLYWNTEDDEDYFMEIPEGAEIIKSSKNIRDVTKDKLKYLNGNPLNVNYKGREGKVWYDENKKLCYDFGDGVKGTNYTSISAIIEDLKTELESSRKITSGLDPYLCCPNCGEPELFENIKDNNIKCYNCGNTISYNELKNLKKYVSPHSKIKSARYIATDPESGEVLGSADTYEEAVNEWGEDVTITDSKVSEGLVKSAKKSVVDDNGCSELYKQRREVLDSLGLNIIGSNVGTFIYKTFDEDNRVYPSITWTNTKIDCDYELCDNEHNLYYSGHSSDEFKNDLMDWMNNVGLNDGTIQSSIQGKKREVNSSRKPSKPNYYDVGGCSFCGAEGTDTVENFLKKYGFKDIEHSCDILDVDPLEEVCEDCFKSWLPELNNKTYSEYNEFGVDTRTGQKINQSIKSSVSASALEEKLDGQFWTRTEDFEEEVADNGWDVEEINHEYATISDDKGSQYEVRFYDHGDGRSFAMESFKCIYGDEDDDDINSSYRKEIVTKILSGKLTDDAAAQIVSMKLNYNKAYAKEIVSAWKDELKDSLIESGIRDIADDINKEFDIDGDIESWSKEYLADDGDKATTVGGEIIRAFNIIAYRWFNDGDEIGKGYGRETVNPAARYLMDKCTLDVNSDIEKMLGNEDLVDDYDEFIDELTDEVESFLRDNSDLFHTPNKDDFNDWADKEYDVDNTLDEVYLKDEYGNKWGFKNNGNGTWECNSIETYSSTSLDIGDIISEGDDWSYEIKDKTDDYGEFTIDGVTYEWEASGDPDDGDYSEWEIIDVYPENNVCDEGFELSADDILRWRDDWNYTVTDESGRNVSDKQLRS